MESTLPIPSRTGAPVGNQNRVTHGMYKWAATGKLPRKYHRLRTELRYLREELEREIFVAHGRSPTTYEHKLITDVVRHEGIARLAENRLASDSNSLNVPDMVSLFTKIGAATDAGTKAIKALNIDRGASDAFDSIYSQPPPARRPVATGGPDDDENTIPDLETDP